MVAGFCGAFSLTIDEPGPDEAQLTEGGTPDTATVTVSSSAECTVDIDFVDQSSGSDGYQILNVPMGQDLDYLHLDDGAPVSFDIKAVADDDHVDETIIIRATPLGDGHFTSQDAPSIPADPAESVTVTITDADTSSSDCQPLINGSFDDDTDILEGEPLALQFTTDGTCSGNIEVSLVLGSQPHLDDDFEILHNGNALLAADFPDDFPENDTLLIKTKSDQASESNETFTVKAKIDGETAERTITIVDVPHCSYTVTPSVSSLNEKDAHPWAESEITVSTSSACAGTIDLSWTDDDGDRVEAADYDVVDLGNSQFQNGGGLLLTDDGQNATGKVKLRLLADDLVEQDSGTITFSVAGDAADANVTIDDDDGAGVAKLDITTDVAAAAEPGSQYYCTAATDGVVEIEPTGTETWSSAGVTSVTFKLLGTAGYDATSGDYTLSVEDENGTDLQTTEVEIGNSTYVSVDLATSPDKIVVTLTPSSDTDETEADETAIIELLSSAPASNSSTVTISDESEAVTIVQTADATEASQGRGTFAIRPANGTADLCGKFRLLIDTGNPGNATPTDDYTLEQVSPTPATTLTTGDYSPGVVVAPATGEITVANVDEILIDVIPVDDAVTEPDETVVAQVLASPTTVPVWLVQSGSATVTIANNAAAIADADISIDLEPDPQCISCAARGIEMDLHTGSPTIPIVPGLLDFIGEGSHGTQPIIRGQFARPAGDWQTTIDVEVEVLDWSDNSIATSAAFELNVSTYDEDAVAFAVPVDLPGIATGSYKFELTGDDGTHQWSAETSHFVSNRWDNNSIAPGLSFPFLKKVVSGTTMLVNGSEDSGVALIRGDNSVSWYHDDGSSYDTPAETVTDLSLETVSGDDFYVFTDKFGNEDWFAKDAGYIETVDGVSEEWPIGAHYKQIDSNDNETIFVYDGSSRLSKIINPQDRKTEIDYSTSGNVTTVTITDFADRDTVLEYDTTTSSAPDLEVLYPDPDISGIDAGPQPKHTFTYDNQFRITTITRDAGGSAGSSDQVTYLTYDSLSYTGYRNWRRLASTLTADNPPPAGIKYPDLSEWTLEQYRQSEALPDDADDSWDTVGANAVTVPLLVSFENTAILNDGRGNTTTYKLDHRGRELEMTDALDQTFVYERDSEFGELLSLTTPDPDDFTSRPDVTGGENYDLSPQKTSYTYDSVFNVTDQTLPDLGTGTITRTWSGFDLGRPGEFVDELGHTVDYAVDANTGNVTQDSAESPDSLPNRGMPGSENTNPENNLDADGSGAVSSMDALDVTNEINANGVGDFDPDSAAGSGYLDTNGDGSLSSSDVLAIANHLNDPTDTNHQPTSTAGYQAPADHVIDYTYTDSTDSLPNGLILTKTVTTGRTNNLKTVYDYYDGSESGTQAEKDARFGLVESITYADGTTDEATVSFTYDTNGNLKSSTDELSRVTEYVYDNLNRLIKITSADPDDTGSEKSLVTSYVYDAFGNVAIEKLDNYNPETSTDTDHTTCYYYDGMNRPLWQVAPDPDANTGTASCDVTTLPTTWTAAQNVTEWQGRPITHYVEYDGNGNLESLTDPEDRTTDYEYDKLNRLVKVIEPGLTSTGQDASLETGHGEVLESGNRPVTTMLYDNLGNLWSVTDSLGNTTNFRYDAWNRPISMEEPKLDPADPEETEGRTTRYAYSKEAYGWVKQTTDPEDRVTETQTDFHGRVLYVAEPAVDGAPSMTWFQYHDDGQIESVIDAEGNITNYEYDQRARLEKVLQPAVINPDTSQSERPTTIYTYDDANQTTKITDPLGRETTYAYDDLGRVTLITPPDPDDDGQTNGPEVSPTISYVYDAVGNRLTTSDALGHEMSYEYDHLFRPTKSIDALNDATLFTYDLVNNRETLTDPEGNATTWEYDALDRVYSETNESNDERTFLYDAVGNLRTLTDRNGRVTTYDYDTLYRVTQEQWDVTDRIAVALFAELWQ